MTDYSIYDTGRSSKNRESESAEIEAFLNDGGRITSVPNSRKMKVIRTAKKREDISLEKRGASVLIDLSA